MKLITVHLPKPYIQALDKLVHDKYYPNRAEAIRIAVRDLLNSEQWKNTCELRIDVDAGKIYEFTDVFHRWNRRELDPDKAMFRISNIFENEIRAQDMRNRLLKKAVPLKEATA